MTRVAAVRSVLSVSSLAQNSFVGIDVAAILFDFYWDYNSASKRLISEKYPDSAELEMIFRSITPTCTQWASSQGYYIFF